MTAPFARSLLGWKASSKNKLRWPLVPNFADVDNPPRVVVIVGCILMLAGVLYASTLTRGAPYFPSLVLPLVIAGIGIGVINVPLVLSLIASVGFDRIGPTSAIAVMLRSLGGPMVLAVVQTVIIARTLQLGGTSGPVKVMNAAQLHALDRGYTYGLQWLAGVVVVVGGAALLIGYSAQQVAHAQEVKKAFDSGTEAGDNEAEYEPAQQDPAPPAA